MSCRILGRDLESWMLNSIILDLKKRKIKKLIGEIAYTNQNSLVHDFFKFNNFTKVNSNLKKKINNQNYGNRPFKKEIYACNVNDIKIRNLDKFKK